MPDASRGVPLHRMETGVFVPVAAPSLLDHIAYPVAQAEARERVVEAARKWQHLLPLEVLRELAALDALEGADTEGHDA